MHVTLCPPPPSRFTVTPYPPIIIAVPNNCALSLLISNSNKTCLLQENRCPEMDISYISFQECANTSRNDLEQKSEWEPLPRVLKVKAGR